MSRDTGISGARSRAVDDCVATIADLEQKGAAVVNPHEERPYGVEALIRDNYRYAAHNSLGGARFTVAIPVAALSTPDKAGLSS